MAPRLDIPVDQALADEVRQAAAARGQSVAEYARRALSPVRVTRDQSVYAFEGHGPSMVKDAAVAAGWSVPDVERADATDRLRRFASQSEHFAVTTTSASEIIAPGYRTVAELAASADRPLAASANRETISDASPFVVPNVSGTDTVGDHSEGSAPTEESLAIGSVPATPQGVSGRLPLTRELVDSASPSGDLVALAAMREDYARQVEERIYAELNGAKGQAGTITGGFVSSGAQASTSTGTALTADLKKAFARYASVRGRKPRNAVVAGTPAEILAEGLDESTGDEGALWRPMGVATNAATVAFGSAAGDADVVILGSNDLWLWESPLLQFHYTEKSGPAIVEINLWGYVAVLLVRPRGLSAIRWTSA